MSALDPTFNQDRLKPYSFSLTFEHNTSNLTNHYMTFGHNMKYFNITFKKTQKQHVSLLS